MRKKFNILKLILSIIISQLAGFIGSIFTFNSVNSWYLTLNKPFFNPPSWIFGPVWVSLYFLIGISFYLIWNNGFKSKTSKLALGFFITQLILNSLWSIIFFGLKSPLFAFIEIILLWISIVLTMYYFSKISKTATYLLIPYILWVSFASILNLAMVILN
ncbi:MAG: TspO/MBR family protein [Candidatus Pacearchaeota archaeon]